MTVIFSALLSLLFMSGTPVQHDLTVTITNIEKPSGTIYLGLYNNADDFPEEGLAIKSASVVVNGKTATYTFSNLPSGNYAVALYHDTNGDGKINKNWMGIPKEGYGFSTNFKPKLKAPKFEQVMVAVPATNHIEVALIQ